jgi:hypothetical protein
MDTHAGWQGLAGADGAVTAAAALAVVDRGLGTDTVVAAMHAAPASARVALVHAVTEVAPQASVAAWELLLRTYVDGARAGRPMAGMPDPRPLPGALVALVNALPAAPAAAVLNTAVQAGAHVLAAAAAAHAEDEDKDHNNNATRASMVDAVMVAHLDGRWVAPGTWSVAAMVDWVARIAGPGTGVTALMRAALALALARPAATHLRRVCTALVHSAAPGGGQAGSCSCVCSPVRAGLATRPQRGGRRLGAATAGRSGGRPARGSMLPGA